MAEPDDPRTCEPGADGIPTCSTGPAGRLGFVVRELAGLWRERRAGRTDEEPDTEEEKD